MKKTNITSTEMYRNMKTVPSEDSNEYEAFALEEWRKVRDGVTIAGVYISGWLYWHLNHWKLHGDTESGDRLTIHPDLRDNEWMIAEGLMRAEEEKKILCIFGARQIAKTAFSASYLTRKATIITNSQNLIIGASKGDLTNITNDIDFGLLNVSPMFRMYRITRDWKSGEVYLGVKSTVGDNQVHSMFRIRNTESGRNTEVTAGTRPSSALIDEAGKGPFAKVLAALLPGMRGKFGLRAPVIVTGTGGDFEKGKDAETMFFHPDTNDVVEYVSEKTGKKTGLFMPGWLRQDFKVKSNLAEYLGVNKPKLKEITMYVSDKELAVKTLKSDRAIAAKDPDATKLLKKIMYDPLDPEEVFLTETGNIFPKELLLEQKQWLSEGNAPHCDYVDLYTDSDNVVRHKFTEKKPILNYPSFPSDNLDGAIQIWEFPIHESIPGLYVAATDPYKHPQSANSNSVGSTYIFKRIYDPINDKFQNIIVAAYHARPRKLETWYENTKLLLKFYSCRTVCENEDRGFIQSCMDSNTAHIYLVPQVQQIIDGIHPNSQVHRDYGVHATPELINHFNTSIVFYMQEVIKTNRDENGELKEVLGVRRIIDPLLLDELIRYDGDMNADRVRAFGIVLAYAKSLDRNPISQKKDNRYKLLSPDMKINKSPYRKGVNPFVGIR